MRNIAMILRLDENIEEEAFIRINDIEFTVFVAYTPFDLEINKQYPVEIAFFGDDVNICKNRMPVKGIVQKKNSFESQISGYLDEQGNLDVGFPIRDELLQEFLFLTGNYITISVDRIDVEILEN